MLSFLLITHDKHPSSVYPISLGNSRPSWPRKFCFLKQVGVKSDSRPMCIGLTLIIVRASPKTSCYKRGHECCHTTDVTHALNLEPRNLIIERIYMNQLRIMTNLLNRSKVKKSIFLLLFLLAALSSFLEIQEFGSPR